MLHRTNSAADLGFPLAEVLRMIPAEQTTEYMPVIQAILPPILATKMKVSQYLQAADEDSVRGSPGADTGKRTRGNQRCVSPPNPVCPLQTLASPNGAPCPLKWRSFWIL